MFKKKESILFKDLPLLNDGFLNVRFKFCKVYQEPVTKDYIPEYKEDYIYSNKISELALPNSQNSLSYRVYNKDGNFIQLNYEDGILKDSLYFEKRFSIINDNNQDFQSNIDMASRSEIELVDPETGEMLSYIRDIDNDSYDPKTKEGSTILAPLKIDEHFKFEDKKQFFLFMIFYRNVESDLDGFEDVLLYIEFRENKVNFYNAYLIDSSNISFNS